MAFRTCGLVLLFFVIKGIMCFPRSSLMQHLHETKEMLQLTTGHKMRDYVGYGNYCGYGGSGPVLDPIDMCCKIHDDCYGDISYFYGDICDPHKGSYDYTVSLDTRRLGCTTEFNICGKDVCLCDEQLVGCFQKYDMYYDRSLVKTGRIARSLLMTSIGLLLGK